MVNFNNLLAIIICVGTMSSAVVVKAEESELIEQLKSLRKAVNGVVFAIDTKDLQEKAFVVEEKAQNFFTKNPMVSVAAGSFFVGRGWVNYKNSNNAAKYINTYHFPMSIISKELANQIENGTQQAKDIFVRSCKKAGRRNTLVGFVFLGGHVFYNHVKQNENSVEEDQHNELPTDTNN